MSEKSRQFLHGEFVKAGLNVGTAEEFDSLMVNNAESRNWAKAQAERLGFDTTDFDRKMTDVTITPTNENVAVSDTTKPTDTPAQILARTKEKATSNNAKTHTYSTPVLDTDVLANEYKAKADQARQAGNEQAAKQAEQAAQAIIEGKAVPFEYLSYTPPTQEEIEARVKEIEARINNPQTPEDYVLRRQENVRRNAILGTRNFGLDMTLPKYNSLSGTYTYTSPVTKEQGFYDKAGNKYDNIFDAEAGSRNYDAMVRASKQKADYINSLDQRIADTENKIKEVQAEQAKKTSNANKGASAFMPASARAITETQTAEQLAPQETEELKQLHATLKDLHDMKTTVQAQNELTKSDGFFDWNNAKNIWRGLSDTYTDPYFYSSFLSFGATDLTDAQTKAKVFDKIEKGQELTDTEMQLALASGMADDIKSSADLPIGYTGAKIAGESLPFILQMALNPATGLAKTAAKAAVRKVGRSGLWAVTARVGARALGATAEAAVLANTIQAGATAADIIDRKTGKVKLGFDENGYLIPTEIDDKKSWGQAIYEGEASKIIENATELMGLPGMGKLTKATAKGLEKLGLKNVRKTINTLSRSKMSQFLEKAGWHGPLGEIFEEEAGMFFNIVAQVGDNKWSDFYDIKKQSEIALGCSLFGGVVSVYTTTSAATSLALDAKAERRIKSTDAIAKGRLTESRWLPIKEEFDNALDSEREEMVGRIMSDTSLQPQEKKAMLDYFSAAVYWEGRNQAKAITALESKPTPTQRAINATEEAYQQGMLADNPSDQYDAMEQLRTAEQKVRDFFGWDESVDVDDEIKSYFGTSDQVALLEQLKDYTDDVQDLFADYLFARTKYDGVIEGQAQRVDAGVAELTERLSAESHAARQEMVSATLVDGTACTIIGGNFELTDDGRIDTEKSDQTVIIMRDGEKKMISADQVGNVTTMPIEQVINEQVTAYRQQADTEFENGINLVAQSRQQAEAAEQQQAQAEQAQEEAPQAEEQATEVAEEEQPTIPVDAKGNPLYEQATPELVVQDIFNNQGLPADIATQFVDNKLAEAKKIAEKLAKKEPKIGTNIAQYKEAMVQWQQATTEAQNNIAFWEEVKAVASQRNQPTEETTPVVEVEEQAEETTEAEQPTEEAAEEVTLETEEVAEEQTPIAETQAENTQSVAETQAETPQAEVTEETQAEEQPQAEQTEVAEETPTEEQPSAETAEKQPQAEQTEEVTEEYINEVIDKLRDVYESLANEAQTDINNNLESFKAEVASRTDEEIATAIADIESTPDLVELFERVRNGLLSGEIKGTEQEERELTNVLQRIAQGNVAKDMLLPIFKAEQQKRAEQQTESKTDLADAAEDARRKPLRQRAKEWEQKTGTKVVIVEDETEIEQESARRQVAESKVMGWYNRKSGEVYLYMPNLMSEEDIDNTFIHEVVIHKGLRGLLKPQAYNSVMQRVFDSLSPEQQAKWLNYPGVKGDAIKAADEYIANTFESIEVENPSLWQKFVDAIRTALINMGINLKVSDATLGSLIRQSYRKMAEQKAMEIPTEMIEVANEIPADASAETSFSIKIAHTLNEKSMEYAKQKGVSEEFMDALRKAEADINQMAERISQDLGGDLDAKRRGKRMLPEEVNVQDGKPLKGYSTIFKNGSYGRTMENTLKCLRTLAYIDFVNDVKERIGRPLTSQESFLASQMLYDISVDPQCLYCYVSLDRKAYDEFLIRYLNQRDAVITAYDSLSAKDKKNPKVIDELYQDFLASRKDTKEMKRRFNMWIDARKAGLPLLNAADVATTTRRDNIRNNGDASLNAQLKDAEAYAQGASWAKKEDEYRAYTGEILRLPQSTVNTLNKEYGLRFYSFSEYSPAFIVENMQMIRDAAIRGLRGLAYTKETDFVKIFAPSQININVSVFGRRDANGNMVADTRQGADWAEAKALREQYPHVGAVFVATNDADVEWALAQDWIDVVIPFHIVRTGADIANFYEWVNYSSEQADKDAKGRKADISPVEHLNSKERYMQLVEERNLTPRFAKWSDNPNYMKLVNETRRPYNQTPTLTPSFMLNEALTSWSEFNEKGGYYGGWYNVDEQGYQDAVAQVTEDIQEGRTAKDVDYGRQDVPADAWNTKRQTREQRVHHNAPLTNASEITQEESANDEDIAFSVADDAVNTADTFTSAAEAIAQQLGVEIEIDESIPAKGSYNPRTGRIRINPSRHATAEDVQRTVLHETIGHGGIQAVAGKRFGQVCQQVYDMMSEEQRADIRSRHGNLSDEAVGAEYMAEMAEKGKVDITTWGKVKAMVRNMLMSMGINLNLTDADIRYMLYSAHQLAEKGKLQDAINRATALGKLRRQAELSHDVAEDAMSRPLMRPIDPDLIELTTGELGLTDVQVIDADTLEKMFDSTKLAKANKHSIFTQFKNNFVDRTRPVAKFIQQVYGLKNIGEAYVWDPESNPHIGANLAPSKAMRRTQVFRQGKMKDLLDTYNNLWVEWRKANRGFGVEYAQAMARLYAIAKTAQERQAIKGKGKNDTDFAGVTGVLKWIGMTVKVHNGKFLKPINWETEASTLGKDHDELTIAECEAILAQHGYPSMQEFIAEFEKGVDVKEFWNMTQAISHDMLRNQLEAGLLSPTSYQILMYGKSFVEIAKAKGEKDTNNLIALSASTNPQDLVSMGYLTADEVNNLAPYYQHYLPLKDSTDIEQTDVVDYGGNRKVEGSKRAVQSVTGHSNMVGDPIARLCYDYTVAIHNEEENKWKLQLLDIVRHHQSTTPPKNRMAVATSRKYINGLIGAFDEVRINPHAMSEHEVAVFENGSQVVIRFADKSIAEAVNPEKVKVGKFLQTLNKFNRFLANAYTSKNPAFVVPNVIRDYQAGFQYNLAKGRKQWKKYHKMMFNARSRQALYDLLLNREDHSAWGNTKYAQYVQEFLDNGGPTAVNQMASLDNIQDELNKTAKAINEAKTPLSGLKKGARATTEWLGRMGEMAELTTRLATYIAARECGKSVSLAALEAKEVSVNFDRKGKASIRKYFPLFSIFQNAALQSLRREMGLMREAPWTYTAYRLIKPAMHIGLSIYVGMLINGIDGDDEEEVKEYLLNYFSVNSHTASANFLIPTSKGITFSIPAAIDDMGFNKLAFLITKRVMLNSITGQAYNAEESVMDDVIEVVSQFADMAGQNPLTVGLSTLTPSFDDMEVGERVVYAWSANPVFSPFIQTGLNRDYKGEKFYGEPIVDQGRPRNYYDWNKHSFGHSVAKLLNDATGGNDAVPGFINIQGAAIDLFLSSYLGGYGDFASKTLDTGKNAGELLFGDGKIEEYGKEKEIGLADVISDLPVAYRFAKAPIEVYGEIGVKDHVVRLKNKANEWERQIVNQYKDGYIEDAQEMLQDGNGSGSAQDYYLSIGRSKIYEWSKDIPNAKTLYEDMMSETYHNGEYSTLGQAAIIIGQAEMFSSLIKGNFDDLENPNDASYLYEDIKKYYLPTMKEILKEAEPEEANAEIEAIAQEIVDYYNELGNPTPHTKDTKLYKEDE